MGRFRATAVRPRHPRSRPSRSEWTGAAPARGGQRAAFASPDPSDCAAADHSNPCRRAVSNALVVPPAMYVLENLAACRVVCDPEESDPRRAELVGGCVDAFQSADLPFGFETRCSDRLRLRVECAEYRLGDLTRRPLDPRDLGRDQVAARLGRRRQLAPGGRGAVEPVPIGRGDGVQLVDEHPSAAAQPGVVLVDDGRAVFLEGGARPSPRLRASRAASIVCGGVARSARPPRPARQPPTG